MKNKKILFSLILISFLGACQKKFKCKSYNSEIISQTVNVSEFSKINLEMHADIYYTQGDNQSVTIEAPTKLMEHISSTVFQNTLKLDLENDFCFSNKKAIKIFIVTPELNEIDIEGSGDFKIENLLTTENLKLKISGSGDFYADSLSVNIFNTSISGSGDIFASGIDTMSQQTIKISGSGDIDLMGLPCSETSISISGSGDCKVNSIDNLDVKISGSGEVRYVGNPTVNSDITGSGSVKQF
ncbi:MAG: head GIN domain-containing protein [Crocinitomicaceae bacterium]